MGLGEGYDRKERVRLRDFLQGKQIALAIIFFYNSEITAVQVVIAVYRLWRCKSTGKLDDMGIASINEPYNRGRSYWFPRTNRINVTCIFSPLEDIPPSPPSNQTSAPSSAPVANSPTYGPTTQLPTSKPTTQLPSYRPTQHPTRVNQTNNATTTTSIDPLYANLTYGAIHTTDITKATLPYIRLCVS